MDLRPQVALFLSSALSLVHDRAEEAGNIQEEGTNRTLSFSQ